MTVSLLTSNGTIDLLALEANSLIEGNRQMAHLVFGNHYGVERSKELVKWTARLVDQHGDRVDAFVLAAVKSRAYIDEAYAINQQFGEILSIKFDESTTQLNEPAKTRFSRYTI